jgi:hypothetical protein
MAIRTVPKPRPRPTPRPRPLSFARIWPSAAEAIAKADRSAVAPLVVNPGAHLQSRFSFGATPSMTDWIAKHGPDAWWDSQVALGQAHSGYSACPEVAAQGPQLGTSPAQARAWLKANGHEYGWQVMDQLTRVTLGLQAWSQAQLYETVVDFFSNHLNVANHSGDVWSSRHVYDRDVIRRHAFGSFTDMLIASSKSPAMLRFLNLAQSSKQAVNENYGRELLELHTVGLEAGYTEADVKNSARMLTGRALDADFNYLYRPERHWTGAIRVLDFTHPNTSSADGDAGGDAYLSYLAAHPSTAQRLARKLCIRFVSDAPSASLVSVVARTYLANRTQILPTLQAIFRSDEFWASRGRKTRRPTENLIATVRVLGVTASDMSRALAVLHWMSGAVGQTPLDWPAPNGYPDLAASWRSSGTLVNLWTYHRGFVQNWWHGLVAPTPEAHYGGVTPATSGAAITLLTRRLTGQSFSAAHTAALQEFLAEPASTPLAKSNLRWYLGHLIPLILDGPHHALR